MVTATAMRAALSPCTYATSPTKTRILRTAYGMCQNSTFSVRMRPYTRGCQGQFLTKSFISAKVASDLILLARQLITHMLSGVYPFALSFLSSVGELFLTRRDPVMIGIPSSGHVFGIVMSSSVTVHSRPCWFARSLALDSILWRGSAACFFLLCARVFAQIRSLFAS